MSIRPVDALLPAGPSEADRKAIRAFWRGVFCGAFGVAILASIAGYLT